MDSEPENSDNSGVEEERGGSEGAKGPHASSNGNGDLRMKREESSGVESSSEEDEEEEEESSGCKAVTVLAICAFGHTTIFCIQMTRRNAREGGLNVPEPWQS